MPNSREGTRESEQNQDLAQPGASGTKIYGVREMALWQGKPVGEILEYTPNSKVSETKPQDMAESKLQRDNAEASDRLARIQRVLNYKNLDLTNRTNLNQKDAIEYRTKSNSYINDIRTALTYINQYKEKIRDHYPQIIETLLNIKKDALTKLATFDRTKIFKNLANLRRSLNKAELNEDPEIQFRINLLETLEKQIET